VWKLFRNNDNDKDRLYCVSMEHFVQPAHDLVNARNCIKIPRVVRPLAVHSVGDFDAISCSCAFSNFVRMSRAAPNSSRWIRFSSERHELASCMAVIFVLCFLFDFLRLRVFFSSTNSLFACLKMLPVAETAPFTLKFLLSNAAKALPRFALGYRMRRNEI